MGCVFSPSELCLHTALGIEDGRIHTDQITYSDFPASVPKSINESRLIGPMGNEDLAWWPDPDSPERWIQVDLQANRFITGVTTQGRRRTDGQLQYVTKYTVQFSYEIAEDSFEYVKMSDSDTSEKLVRDYLDLNNVHLQDGYLYETHHHQ